MHIPDGFLSIEVIAITYAIAIAFWFIAFRNVKDKIDEKTIPLAGILSAGVFGAQMLNFPIIGGTSGHLLGAFLIAVLLGVYPSIIMMTVIFFIQALFFGDGGITAIASNTLNMGILSMIVGIALYKIIYEKTKNFYLAIGVGSYVSVIVASVLTALVIGLSGIVDLIPVLIVMVGWHSVIAFGEVFITVGVLSYIKKVKSELLKFEKLSPKFLEVKE